MVNIWDKIISFPEISHDIYGEYMLSRHVISIIVNLKIS